jgi:hypothetical protein
MAQVVERLPNKCEALSSNSSNMYTFFTAIFLNIQCIGREKLSKQSK